MCFFIERPTWAPLVFVLACLVVVFLTVYVLAHSRYARRQRGRFSKTACIFQGLPSHWPAGQSPLALFNKGEWLLCASAIMTCLAEIADRRMTQDAVSETGVLRELLLIEEGQGSSIPLEDLRDEIEEIEAMHNLRITVALAGVTS